MLFEPWELGSRRAKNHVLFGPHVTNLGIGRRFSPEHCAYYERRAVGGVGVIVTETASVHPSDWPYERSPLASECGEGWRNVAHAVHQHGTLVVASLGHCGMQGSTTYNQGVLWAPSVVPNVMTHEMPVAIDAHQIGELRLATLSAAAIALEAGCDGVELNVGQFSIFRQFLSGLTNQRSDEFALGNSLVSELLDDLRNEIGDGIVGLRFCADELAPWAGITPEGARDILSSLDHSIDYVVIERGSIYSEAATRPDMQAGVEFNRELLATMLATVRPHVTVVAQGSIVDVEGAGQLIADGLCGAVEMTRALIADPDLVVKSMGEFEGAVRPCILCNQGCQVRDVRNPIVSCSVNPTAGYEFVEGDLDVDARHSALNGTELTVLGAGPAGLEVARRAALGGARVTIIEKSSSIGGALRSSSRLPGRERWLQLVEWYRSELDRLGVSVQCESDGSDVVADVVAVGRELGSWSWRDGNDGSIPVQKVDDVLEGDSAGGTVLVIDPIGGVIGVGVAQLLAQRGWTVTLVTPDLVAATQLSLTGDLVAANGRLANVGVRLRLHATAVAIAEGLVTLEDRYDGAVEQLRFDEIIDAGFDLPSAQLWKSPVIGDAMAPRNVYAAILEGRRAVAHIVAGVSR